jgi:hypothetical protein
VTDPADPAVDPGDEPVPAHRQHIPASPAEMRRKLLFGVALICSLASVYTGLFQVGRPIQLTLAAMAVLVVLVALISGAPGPPTPPAAGGPGSPERPPA